MTKEQCLARINEIQQVIANTRANLYAMEGQILELKFWVREFEKQEAQALKLVPQAEAPAGESV